jgi:hypothetical protein
MTEGGLPFAEDLSVKRHAATNSQLHDERARILA